MELNEIMALMDRFDASCAGVLELEQGEWRLRLEKAWGHEPAERSPYTVPKAAPVPAAEREELAIKAPLVGTFYSAPAPGEAPFVSPGDRVKKGQTVCVLEAMKMMSEIPAPMDCVIEAVLLQDGDLAGFDAPLFRVREG